MYLLLTFEMLCFMQFTCIVGEERACLDMKETQPRHAYFFFLISSLMKEVVQCDFIDLGQSDRE